MATQLHRRLLGWLLPVAVAVTVAILALAVVEGLSSLVLVAYDAATAANTTIATHMQPDTLVGWSNTPNTRLANAYGAGRNITINSQAFRGSEQYEPAIPPGKVRVLCSGDSFTFGVGVADAASWCARLQAHDQRLQTVNLGHAGWGVDQAYLFYNREGLRLQHDVHILAFIPDDFTRLRLRSYRGYPKPLFRMQDGKLVLTNVPVRRPSRLARLFSSQSLGQLRFMNLGERLMSRISGKRRASQEVTRVEGRDIMLRLFEDLQARSRQNGGTFAVVLLEEDLTSNDQEQWLVQFLTAELAKRGIVFVDLWSEFRQKPADELAPMFDVQWRHYSPEGNDWVAAEIYRRLQGLPQLASRLKGAVTSTPTPARPPTFSRAAVR